MVFAHLRIIDYFHGSVAQLGERFVRNEEAGGSTPPDPFSFAQMFCHFVPSRLSFGECSTTLKHEVSVSERSI